MKILAVLEGRHRQTHLNCRQLSSGIEDAQHLVLNAQKKKDIFIKLKQSHGVQGQKASLSSNMERKKHA